MQDKYNDAELIINNQNQKIAADEEQKTVLSEGLKHKTLQLEKLQKTR